MSILLACSGTGQTSAPAPVSFKNKEFSFSGRVGAVDVAARKITIKTEKGPVLFNLTDKTKIIRDGRDDALKNAKIGEAAGVRIKMTADGKAFDVISVNFYRTPLLQFVRP
jgi:hypothetical protein